MSINGPRRIAMPPRPTPSALSVTADIDALIAMSVRVALREKLMDLRDEIAKIPLRDASYSHRSGEEVRADAYKIVHRALGDIS